MFYTSSIPATILLHCAMYGSCLWLPAIIVWSSSSHTQEQKGCKISHQKHILGHRPDTGSSCYCTYGWLSSRSVQPLIAHAARPFSYKYQLLYLMLSLKSNLYCSNVIDPSHSGYAEPHYANHQVNIAHRSLMTEHLPPPRLAAIP